MENKKGSLSTVFLVIAIILIILMGVFIYMQKTEADRQIAELENNASELKETIKDLQGKINTISNIIGSTTEKIKFDTTIELNEIESLDYSNKSQLQSFHSKYEGKTVKITGYVSGIEDNVIVTSVDTAETVVHIGNLANDAKWIVSGTSADLNVRNQINELKSGQKISIVGVISKEAQPIELNDIKVIVEQSEVNINNQYSILTEPLKDKDVLYVTKAEKNSNNTYTLYGVVFKCNENVNPDYQISDTWTITEEYKKITISSDTICISGYPAEEEITVGKYFNNYGEVEVQDVVVNTTLYDKCTYFFEFKDGKCIKVIDYCTGI